MKIYLLRETMEECSWEELSNSTDTQFVAVLTPAEWQKVREQINMGIEMDLDPRNVHNTKAEVNYDSLTGTFQIPDRSCLTDRDDSFVFALDERGIVFIDEGDKAEQMIDVIRRTKRWRSPSLERFLYDFLEQIVSRDLPIMEGYETELDAIEDSILAGEEGTNLVRVNEIRSAIRELRVHYEQLIDMAQELEENENGFFTDENLRYIHLFMNRMQRLHDTSSSLRDHTMQVRDLYHGQLEVRQNHIMTLLTVVTTIFMPLTLIAGWYGMNFRYMPELDKQWGYPVVIAVCLVIVVVSLIFFKKKKWM